MRVKISLKYVFWLHKPLIVKKFSITLKMAQGQEYPFFKPKFYSLKNQKSLAYFNIRQVKQYYTHNR